MNEKLIKRYLSGEDDWKYYAISAYRKVDVLKEKWLSCPNCGLIPKIWTYDNGRSTACGCGDSKYKHHTVKAESIMSCHQNDGNTANYDCDALRKNWNHWCKTGEKLFDPNYEKDERW